MCMCPIPCLWYPIELGSLQPKNVHACLQIMHKGTHAVPSDNTASSCWYAFRCSICFCLSRSISCISISACRFGGACDGHVRQVHG